MIHSFLPRRPLHLLSLWVLLLALTCGLYSCGKGAVQAPKTQHPLTGTLWTEGEGTMLLDFISDSEVRFTLTPTGTTHTMEQTSTYRLEGKTLIITDIILPTPFGEAILLKDFRAQVSGNKLQADFTTASVTVDPEKRTPIFSAQSLKGYLFHRKS